ncbi:hypothetical protein [Pseudomonas sp. DWP3-1-2]|uniref:hypothetical protein n=1 Tax=Pseudomonas sp. DWP3-1-2 TaxID=2804645 RepID=UPI003CF50C20
MSHAPALPAVDRRAGKLIANIKSDRVDTTAVEQRAGLMPLIPFISTLDSDPSG